tara:strand:+ start:454 stop:627 length:174 start_codon:yes stop_codon:yes gene_type:complete
MLYKYIRSAINNFVAKNPNILLTLALLYLSIFLIIFLLDKQAEISLKVVVCWALLAF